MQAVLYSYRRCPYAMRARMALHYAGIAVEIREIVLRDKPQAMLLASPKGTVPVLVLPDGTVLEQSLDIMYWAVQQHDPEAWYEATLASDMQALIDMNDGAFKQALDRYKYPERYPQASQAAHRLAGETFLQQLETQLNKHPFLLKQQPCMADIAIFPFIRQFAAVDTAWFEQSSYHAVQKWLQYLCNSDLFIHVMQKYPVWHA